ncbi:MAG: hypothetical protein H3C47_04365 [Candidatus Cloacimonetes bacterium]|nr:hypothetical protein [Candidatus Cloacimonadota bacterium]
MPRKMIPFHLREFLERQIVRGSRGHEPIEKILSLVSESELRAFLEVYEEKIRDGLADLGSESKTNSRDLDSVARSVLKPEVDDSDDRFSRLLASVTREEDS